MDWRKVEREEQMAKQQELLNKRRNGDAIKEANSRRRKVAVSGGASPAQTAASAQARNVRIQTVRLTLPFFPAVRARGVGLLACASGLPQETLAARQELRRKEKESLAEGVVPDTLKDWRPYKNKADENLTSGIIVPLLPFGIREYDDGERFDLRLPYADEGW